MLQWKSRFCALLAVVVLLLAAFGGYVGDTGSILQQFGW
jgi:hypothetical protein